MIAKRVEQGANDSSIAPTRQKSDCSSTGMPSPRLKHRRRSFWGCQEKATGLAEVAEKAGWQHPEASEFRHVMLRFRHLQFLKVWIRGDTYGAMVWSDHVNINAVLLEELPNSVAPRIIAFLTYVNGIRQNSVSLNSSSAYSSYLGTLNHQQPLP